MKEKQNHNLRWWTHGQFRSCLCFGINFNKPLCAVTPTIPRGIQPSPCVRIVKHKQSEKCWDKTTGTVTGNPPPSQFKCGSFSTGYEPCLHPDWCMVRGKDSKYQIGRDLLPESAASPALHFEHQSRASQWGGVTETGGKSDFLLSFSFWNNNNNSNKNTLPQQTLVSQQGRPSVSGRAPLWWCRVGHWEAGEGRKVN